MSPCSVKSQAAPQGNDFHPSSNSLAKDSRRTRSYLQVESSGIRDSGRNRFLEAPGLTRQQAVWSEQGGYPGRREESTGEACGKHQVSTIVQGHETLGVLLFLFGVSFWLLKTWSLKKTTLVQPQDGSAGKGSCC